MLLVAVHNLSFIMKVLACCDIPHGTLRSIRFGYIQGVSAQHGMLTKLTRSPTSIDSVHIFYMCVCVCMCVCESSMLRGGVKTHFCQNRPRGSVSSKQLKVF